jgi:cell division protein ZipA
MQELRFVLIIVGALAIAALLFHGLWTSRKDGKSKFGNKPLGKIQNDDEDDITPTPKRAFFNNVEEEAEKRPRKEPAFSFDVPASKNFNHSESRSIDPLIDSYDEGDDGDTVDEQDDSSHFSAEQPVAHTQASPVNMRREVETPLPRVDAPTRSLDTVVDDVEVEDEPLEVIVLNVHCATSAPFVGTMLFDSMKQNGLLYGEMDIFHRHADLSGTGKVLFSVANMMQPGTLKHNDPNEFTTKGISFFMTLPCYGDSEQNFKMMLRTAQQIADDMGGNVLDEKRNLMTPDRLAKYRLQIKEFKARNAEK